MLNHHPIDHFNGKVKQQHFGAYLSVWQQKLHKDTLEILFTLCHPTTFDGNFEAIITEEQDITPEDEESEPIKELLVEDCKCISKEELPILFQMFRGEQNIPTCILNTLFCELLNVMKRKDNSVNFIYGNGKCGHAIIMPQVKTLPSFMENVQKLKWVESMLEHI
jgi:hypothetical protein